MKANEFEEARDEQNRREYNVDFTDFPAEANLNYRYPSAEALLDDPDTLIKMIKDHHDVQCKRLAVLDDYYKAKNTNIRSNRRRVEAEKADHRPAHNFAKVGCQFDVGYNTGKSIKFDTDHELTKDVIDTFNDYNDVDGLHAELWLDMDKYGRAYELHYRDEDFNDNVVITNVFETFVVYDTTIKREPILAVRYPKQRFGKYDDAVNVTVYTDEEIIQYKESSLGHLQLTEDTRVKHPYKMVPIIEAQPNRYRQGLYEDVLSLIDLYDAAQADTANYMNDLSNAILVIQGDIEAAGVTTDDLVKQKRANMLILENGVNVNGQTTQLSAGYIYKQYDVAGTEAYKKRLLTNLHTIMNIPDLSDENFAGVQSGEAMKYKLIGFEQMTRVKQRHFDRHLRRRYALLYNIKKEATEVTELDLESVKIIFTPNLPKAIKEELAMLVDAGVELSQMTLYELASFIDKGEDERQRLLDERDQSFSQYDMDR